MAHLSLNREPLGYGRSLADISLTDHRICINSKRLWSHCILVDRLLYGNYWRLIEILPCVEGNLYIFTRYHYKKTEKLDRSQECYILLSPLSLRVLKVHQVKIIEKCKTYTENWDSKRQSAGTLLAYLETMLKIMLFFLGIKLFCFSTRSLFA